MNELDRELHLKKHPRMSGDQEDSGITISNNTETPPHERGSGLALVEDRDGARNTPA